MEKLDLLANRHILIVGDVMTDRYLTGDVTRISPEAPVPVVRFRRSEDRLGGAANVALNIRAMGSMPLLCSVTGTDSDGDEFDKIVTAMGMNNAGIIRSSERTTTVKTRVLGNHQQMLRIDKEDTKDLSDREADNLLKKIRNLLDSFPVTSVILQDYNKGVLSENVIGEVLAESKKRGIPVAVDPKKQNFFSFKGVALFKPNLKEIRDSIPFDVTPDKAALQRASEYLRTLLHHEWTMITLSERGLFMDEGDGREGEIYPTIPRNIADVSGAGDTVISVAALGLAAGFSSKEIAVLSNLAGGQVCEIPGVVPVDMKLLAKELEGSGF